MKNIRHALASATCALLSSHGAQAENLHEVGDWDVSSALLFYTEPGRVQAIEPVFNIKKIIDTDETLQFKLTFDTLTGASANGAVPSTQPQTFTRPSGNDTYQSDASETPLDDTFHDRRTSLAATWSRPSFWNTDAEFGINLSNEFDYLSFGASASFAKDRNNSNTTYSAGVSIARDIISPVGGAPIAFATMQPVDEPVLHTSSDQSKDLVDFITGITQVIDARSLFQLNYSIGMADGYLNDPYKVISVVNATTGRPVFENALQPNLPTVVYENRPDSRIKQSLYGQYKHYREKSGDVFDVSYRFMMDDWGINSHTADFHYRFNFSNQRFFQPHLRLYQQNEADFYTPFYLEGEVPVISDSNRHASADYRLGNFSAYTIGLEYGQVGLHNSWSVAVEYYLQSGDEPAGKVGELRELELFPDVEAVTLRLLYDF